MYKYSKLALGLLALAGMTACSNEDIPNASVAETDEVRYLRISVASNNDPSTRAEFEQGSAEENKVETLDFFFYDVNKAYVSHVTVNAPFDEVSPVETPDHVEKIITSVVPVQLVQGATLPSYVMVGVNSVAPNDIEGLSLNEAQEHSLKSVYNENGNFAMSNSVYYGSDVVANTDNTLIMATPFTSDVLKTKAEMDKLIEDAKTNTAEAIKALSDATIDIYVERYAAKVILQGADGAESIAISDYDTNVKLTFVPEGWTINNFEKEYYFIKSFRMPNSGTAGAFGTFDQINSVLDGWVWNDAPRSRSYWSRTPGYFEQKYPIVADDILDVLGNTVYAPFTGNMDNKYDYKTYYQSYNSFVNQSNQQIGKPGYFIESTVGQDVLTGTNMPTQHNALAAIPSAIVVGHYEMQYNDSKIEVNGDTPTFYTYSTQNGKAVVYAQTPGEIGDVETLSSYLLRTQKILYTKATGSDARNYDLTSLAGEFNIEHPRQAAREGLKVASRIVTLQHNQTNNSTLYFYDPVDKTEKQLNSAANIERANRLLFEGLGGANAYTHGRAFFSAPIQHYGWQRADNANKTLVQREWDWTKMKAGDFGVVRNHKYTIEVSSITGLGTGILNYDDPLLPPSDNVTYNMRFQVLIQKWAVLPTQKVEW